MYTKHNHKLTGRKSLWEAHGLNSFFHSSALSAGKVMGRRSRDIRFKTLSGQSLTVPFKEEVAASSANSINLMKILLLIKADLIITIVSFVRFPQTTAAMWISWGFSIGTFPWGCCLGTSNPTSLMNWGTEERGVDSILVGICWGCCSLKTQKKFHRTSIREMNITARIKNIVFLAIWKALLVELHYHYSKKNPCNGNWSTLLFCCCFCNPIQSFRNAL